MKEDIKIYIYFYFLIFVCQDGEESVIISVFDFWKNLTTSEQMTFYWTNRFILIFWNLKGVNHRV